MDKMLQELNFLSFVVLFLMIITMLAIIVQVVINIVARIRQKKRLKLQEAEEERLRKEHANLMSGYTD